MLSSFRVIMLKPEYKVEVVEHCLCRPNLRVRSLRLETAQPSSRFNKLSSTLDSVW